MKLALLIFLLPTLLPAQTTLERGIGAFLSGRIAESAEILRQASEESPGSAPAHAWRSEALRRLDSFDAAYDAARRAIAIDPCNTVAQTTLGYLFSPQYGSWERANADLSLGYLLSAVRCDSTDGNAWIALWTEAMRRRDSALESRAIRMLAVTGFLTPGALAYGRHYLRYLPQGALLLTTGDMETYPLVALQEAEGFRRDVAVVNVSLLSAPWYARAVIRRNALPSSFATAGLDTLGSLQEEERTISPAERIIRDWIDLRRAKQLSRPIALSVSSWEAVGTGLREFTFSGPYWIYQPALERPRIDASLLWYSLEQFRFTEFTGPFLSERDRSPVRRTGPGPQAGDAVVATVAGYAAALRRLGHGNEAIRVERWIDRFTREVHSGGGEWSR
jgi:tetratricopeptide (TPR) repeat protein